MTTAHNTSIVALFDILRMAQQALEELRAAGFMEEQIGLMASTVEVVQLPNESSEEEEEVEEGALNGILAGAGLGGLFGIGVEIELIPAIGELLLGGFFTSLFAGAVAGAAAGGIIGGLVKAGMHREVAEKVEHAVRAGRTMITVRTDDRSEEAIAILRANGGEVSVSVH
jgi:hypothetical protein